MTKKSTPTINHLINFSRRFLYPHLYPYNLQKPELDLNHWLNQQELTRDIT